MPCPTIYDSVSCSRRVTTPLDVTRSIRSHVVRMLGAVVAVVVVVLGWAASPAGAHTGFESSDPADGSVVEADLDTITIVLTNKADPAGEGFVVLDPELGLREPDSVERPEIGVFVLRFDPAVSAGDVGVRWTVQAPDAHPIEGTFRFTVEASTPPSPSSGTAPDGTTPSASGAEEGSSAPAVTDAVPELDEFLDTQTGSTAGRRISDAGRLIAMAGMMVSLGFIVFATLIMRGTAAELRMLLFWIRRASVAVVVGTILDGAGHVADVSGGRLAAVFDLGA